MQESVLSGATDLIQELRSQVVTAGNGKLTDPDREFLAVEMRSQLD